MDGEESPLVYLDLTAYLQEPVDDIEEADDDVEDIDYYLDHIQQYAD